jgi:hypothetical protein
MRFGTEKRSDLPQYTRASDRRTVADGGLELGGQFFGTGGNHGRRQFCNENVLFPSTASCHGC